MLNSVKLKYINVSHNMCSPIFDGFANSRVMNRSLRHVIMGIPNFGLYVSKKLNFNKSILLKESPFHYPVAKGLLSVTRKSTRLDIPVSINHTVYEPDTSCVYRCYLESIRLLPLKTNSLITSVSTCTTVVVSYRPDVQ